MIARLINLWIAAGIGVGMLVNVSAASEAKRAQEISSSISPVHALAQEYCVKCHDAEHEKGDLNLEAILGEEIARHADVWEDVLTMLREREMPPEDRPRPDEQTYVEVVAWLESKLSKVRDPASRTESSPITTRQALVNEYCLNCHNSKDEKGDMDLESSLEAPVAGHPEVWEKVVRKLTARQMPPLGRERPDEEEYEVVVANLVESLDAAAAENPNPGRTDTFRRLNRTEYENAIRDLLAVEIDASEFLPGDEASHGFDNVTVAHLPSTLVERYITAAQKISRLALGSPGRGPDGRTVRVPADLTQEEHLEGLPIGTRGGVAFEHTFPRDGEYEFKVRLARDRNEHVEGLNEPHEVEILLDRKRLSKFTVKPPGGESTTSDYYTKPSHDNLDQHLKVRVPVEAGPHEVTATFIKKPSVLLETPRQPYEAHYNYYRHPRVQPAIYSVSVTGPYESSSPGDTPSRERIFVCYPDNPGEEESCAQEILSNLARRAYRRPVTDEDLKRPMVFYRQGEQEGGFEAGIEMALNAILVSPEFLFRIERDPRDVDTGEPYRISDLELASRLSFFLWSSIPDEELLDLASEGRLGESSVLEGQVQRMLKDPRAHNLVKNFAGQWLYLRNLESITPNLRLFPDFDDNLRRAFRRETELLFESIVREDRSVLDLLRTDETFLNERLAKHYGIPHVYGSRFRPVSLKEDSKRGGLLRHGSILTVTSYATRTSPVIRGHWVLENLLGTPPPPPPPDVPALEENVVSPDATVRQRLMEHRANPACASCHDMMDPVGFALENFDAVGRWRLFDSGNPIDASGGLPDGGEFTGVSGLEQGLLKRPELFVRTVAEKLLTFALGRGMEYYDAPAIREVLRRARQEDYRFSAMVLGIVESVPFRMRNSK